MACPMDMAMAQASVTNRGRSADMYHMDCGLSEAHGAQYERVYAERCRFEPSCHLPKVDIQPLNSLDSPEQKPLIVV
jgi:hypothetical protein